MNQITKSILLVFQIVLFLIITGTAFSLIYFQLDPQVLQNLPLFTDNSQLSGTLPEAITPAVIHSAISTLLAILFFIKFRNTSSPEASFFMLSLGAFQLMNLRFLILPYIHLTSQHSNVLLIVKICYFGRFFGYGVLFCAGLFSHGVAYLKQNAYILYCFFTAILLAMLIPYETLHFSKPFLYRVGMFTYFEMFLALFEVLIVLNFILASIRNNSNLYLFLGFGVALFLFGNECLLSQISLLWEITGYLCYTIGALVVFRLINIIHQWS